MNPILCTATQVRASAAVILLAVFGAGVSSAQLDPDTTVAYSQYRADPHYDLVGLPEPMDHLGMALAAGDFNGDGYQDLAIGVPREDYGFTGSGSELVDAGVVHVVYGSQHGPDADPDASWDQGNTAGALEQNDQFGWALASGDFDGDGFDDLALGLPGEKIGTTNSDAGGVVVLYGSVDGLTSSDDESWWQDAPGIADISEKTDLFGYRLAVGDFDNDGADDLAIGVPLEEVGSDNNAGAVNILYGVTGVGLSALRNHLIHKGLSWMASSPSTGEFFGITLAVGDLDGDHYDDLIVGAESSDAVEVIEGSSTGLEGSSNYSINYSGTSDPGHSLVVADFNGDGRDDLVVGDPFFQFGETYSNEGAAFLHLSDGGTFTLFQGGPGMQGEAESTDFFAWALAAGDLDGDGDAELVVGVTGQSVSGLKDAGALHIIDFNSIGEVKSDQILDRSHPNFPRAPGTGDRLGFAIVLADFDGNGTDDAAFSSPFRSIEGPSGTATKAGDVLVTLSALGKKIFDDSFETGNASWWSKTVN